MTKFIHLKPDLSKGSDAFILSSVVQTGSDAQQRCWQQISLLSTDSAQACQMLEWCCTKCWLASELDINETRARLGNLQLIPMQLHMEVSAEQALQ